MTIQELADEEDDLYSRVIGLNEMAETDEVNKNKTNKKLEEISFEYKRIHQSYSEQSSRDIEALKRGLFLQWYALVEPTFLTGISELDKDAENELVGSLNELIKAGKIDNELIWMLNYYANWEWVFERNKSFNGFDNNIVNQQNNQLPDSIDKKEMKLRGQMGKYWNSLPKFNHV